MAHDDRLAGLIARPSIPDVVSDFRAYLTRPGNSEWGSLHIVLADGNTGDIHVGYCIEFAREKADTEGERLGPILFGMSRTQRKKLPFAVGRVNP